MSRLQLSLDALTEGMGLNAVCRTFQVSKNTIAIWTTPPGGLKETLMR